LIAKAAPLVVSLSKSPAFAHSPPESVSSAYRHDSPDLLPSKVPAVTYPEKLRHASTNFCPMRRSSCLSSLSLEACFPKEMRGLLWSDDSWRNEADDAVWPNAADEGVWLREALELPWPSDALLEALEVLRLNDGGFTSKLDCSRRVARSE
jgi:hypothetical protein